MMKVVVTKRLNIRVGSPSLNAPCMTYLEPGTTLEVDDTLLPGESFDGNKVWVKDNAGNYYNTSGLNLAPLKEKLSTNPKEAWWLKNFQIPQIWDMGYTGKNVRIAILDTGISYPHDQFDLNKDLFMDLSESPSGWEDIDGHGTHCAGIINAQYNEQGPIGIAHGATLFIGKITSDLFLDLDEFMNAGISWALEQKVDIISISKGDPIKYNNPEIETLLNLAQKMGILVVVSSGNKHKNESPQHIYFPALFPSVLSVGGTDENNRPLSDSILTGETNIFAPGYNIFSTYLHNGYMNLSGSSQATPYVAGICALLLEYQRKTKKDFKASNLKQLLLDNAILQDFGKLIQFKSLFK